MEEDPESLHLWEEDGHPLEHPATEVYHQVEVLEPVDHPLVGTTLDPERTYLHLHCLEKPLCSKLANLSKVLVIVREVVSATDFD